MSAQRCVCVCRLIPFISGALIALLSEDILVLYSFIEINEVCIYLFHVFNRDRVINSANFDTKYAYMQHYTTDIWPIQD